MPNLEIEPTAARLQQLRQRVIAEAGFSRVMEAATSGKTVTLDGVYRPVNADIIEGLKHRCNEHGVIQKMDYIISGDRVKIERGPFSEFICTVDEIKDSRRVWVLIDLMQQLVKAEVLLGDVSKID